MTHEEFLLKLPRLAKDYKAAPEVLKQIGNVILLMIIGPSGVGKTSIINRSGFDFVPTDTTRESRPGEQDGIDMNFRSDFHKVIKDIHSGQFVQAAVFANGELYATKNTS